MHRGPLISKDVIARVHLNISRLNKVYILDTFCPKAVFCNPCFFLFLQGLGRFSRSPRLSHVSSVRIQSSSSLRCVIIPFSIIHGFLNIVIRYNALTKSVFKLYQTRCICIYICIYSCFFLVCLVFQGNIICPFYGSYCRRAVVGGFVQ